MKQGFKPFAISGFVVVVAVAAAMAQAAPRSDVRGTFERTFQVNGPVSLEIKNGAGDITVRSGSSGSVEIRAKIYVGTRDWGESLADSRVHEIEAHPPLEQSGNTIRIEPIELHGRGQNISIDYEIMAPVDSRLHSTTGSGDVIVEGIGGPVEAQTGSGDVKMSGVHGDVSAHTGSGDTKLSAIEAARVDIETGSGDVVLHDLHCALEARTGSGDISAQGEPTGEWRLHTGSGGVTLRLPNGKGFDLHAHAGSGEIRTGLPITIEGTLSHGELRGKVAGGGIPVDVQTGSGDIRID
ncbi:MAG TPA: DUF4097 family beta strand repeat-containing protein [Terriglobia bacterium]|nr:DUF4097 family beta strand repeat-containing protein [Terriglobia bacterium]